MRGLVATLTAESLLCSFKRWFLVAHERFPTMRSFQGAVLLRVRTREAKNSACFHDNTWGRDVQSVLVRAAVGMLTQPS
jgi:hypothetical protein